MNMIKKERITAKHFIIVGSVLLTGWLLTHGIFYPEDFVMDLASDGLIHNVLRGVILVALVAVLLSRPPRSMEFRVILGIISSIVLIGACASMVEYKIGVLDTILYLQVSIILAIEAIEKQTAPVRLLQPQ